MSSKTLFNKQKDLRDQLNAVVKSEWFCQCLIYVRGEIMDRPGLTPAGIDGARAFEYLLLNFTDEETEAAEFPGSGLQHNLEARKPSAQTS